MKTDQRILPFLKLGEKLRHLSGEPSGLYPEDEPMVGAMNAAVAANPWFTLPMVGNALASLGEALTAGAMEQWLAPYRERLDRAGPPRRIGVVMAGNVPAVGFHDFLSVLLAGHRIVARLSASDDLLLPAMAEILCRAEPGFRDRITFTGGKLEGFNAVIATGSGNTSRYFEYYFRDVPHIIRKNRNGIAILSGEETPGELVGLSDDILLYFGLGCRNVSKLFVPPGYDFDPLARALEEHRDLLHHNKYRNNYDYQRSVFLLNGTRFYEAGPILLREDSAIASPVSVVHYEYYHDDGSPDDSFRSQRDDIQCVVSATARTFPVIPPGMAQKPALWEYADGVDTMEFLLSIPQ